MSTSNDSRQKGETMYREPDKYIFIGILTNGTSSLVVKPLMEISIWHR